MAARCRGQSDDAALPGTMGSPSVAEAGTEAWLRARLSRLAPARPSPWPTGGGGAAVLVPIVLAPQPFVLLTRRSALLRHHAGEVSFPGGRADRGDADAVATALREAREEIGLDPGLVEVLGRLPDQDTLSSRFTIVPVVALLSPLATWSASQDEVAAIFGLMLSTLTDPDAPRRMADGPRAGAWVWPHPEQDVWGATAAILVQLARHLSGREPMPSSG